MNILIELFFIFLFLYTIILFKFPDLDLSTSGEEISDVVVNIDEDINENADTVVKDEDEENVTVGVDDTDTANTSKTSQKSSTKKNDNYLWHKFTLFVSIFCFYFILQIIGKIRTNCIINISEILGKCYVVAVSGILGYTLFVDLQIMGWSSENMNKFITSLNGNRYMFTLVVTLFIIMFITVVKLMALMISISDPNKCN